MLLISLPITTISLITITFPAGQSIDLLATHFIATLYCFFDSSSWPILDTELARRLSLT